MSTNDVPGSNPANKDELAMGCWAEHDDGSLIFVDSTENNEVIYSIFDMTKTPIAEYRDSMPTTNFKERFSWPNGDITKITGRWKWHDKSPFPWKRVVPKGAQDGVRYASAHDQLTAAERVAQSVEARAHDLDERRARRMEGRTIPEERETPRQRERRILNVISDMRNRLNELEDELTAANDE